MGATSGSSQKQMSKGRWIRLRQAAELRSPIDGAVLRFSPPLAFA
jgi:hypothetical protein